MEGAGDRDKEGVMDLVGVAVTVGVLVWLAEMEGSLVDDLEIDLVTVGAAETGIVSKVTGVFVRVGVTEVNVTVGVAEVVTEKVGVADRVVSMVVKQTTLLTS